MTNRQLVQIVAIVGLLSILFFFFRYNQERSRRAFVPTPPAPAAPEEKKPAQPVVYTAGIQRDPLELSQMLEKRFFPPRGAAGGPAVMPAQLKVTGVLWGGPKPRAIINGRIVGEGDSVDGARIIKIERAEVVAAVGAQEMRLSVGPAQ